MDVAGLGRLRSRASTRRARRWRRQFEALAVRAVPVTTQRRTARQRELAGVRRRRYRRGARARRLSARARSRRSRRPWRPIGTPPPIGGWMRPAGGACTSFSDRVLKAAAQRPHPAQRGAAGACACWRRSARARRIWRCSRSSPPALHRLIDVCAISGFLSRQIADFPSAAGRVDRCQGVRRAAVAARASSRNSPRAPSGSPPTIRSGKWRRCGNSRRWPCSRWRLPT